MKLSCISFSSNNYTHKAFHSNKVCFFTFSDKNILGLYQRWMKTTWWLFLELLRYVSSTFWGPVFVAPFSRLIFFTNLVFASVLVFSTPKKWKLAASNSRYANAAPQKSLEILKYWNIEILFLQNQICHITKSSVSDLSCFKLNTLRKNNNFLVICLLDICNMGVGAKGLSEYDR